MNNKLIGLLMMMPFIVIVIWSAKISKEFRESLLLTLAVIALSMIPWITTFAAIVGAILLIAG